MKAWHPKAKILDVGCGPGIYVEAMHFAGLDAHGVDSDPRLVEGPWLHRLDIVDAGERRSTFGPANVALSLEVGEHIPAKDAGAYVNFIAGTRCSIVYFSAARPGQGGHGHINCQPKSYWVERFHRIGFWLDPDATAEWVGWIGRGYHLGWLTQNGMVFRRG
jgi:hypothetical protein